MVGRERAARESEDCEDGGLVFGDCVRRVLFLEVRHYRWYFPLWLSMFPGKSCFGEKENVKSPP